MSAANADATMLMMISGGDWTETIAPIAMPGAQRDRRGCDRRDEGVVGDGVGRTRSTAAPTTAEIGAKARGRPCADGMLSLSCAYAEPTAAAASRAMTRARRDQGLSAR